MRNYQVDYSRYSFKAEDDWGDYFKEKFREPWFNKDGYSIKNYFCTDGKWHSMEEHVAKWEYFNGRIPEGLWVDHIIPIKNGGTNILSNLRIGTPKFNSNNELSKKNQSEAKKTLWQNEEYRNKMAEIHNSEEYKTKASESHKGHKWSDEQLELISKPVYLYKNGELIAIYKSRNEAERETGFNRERIAYHCKNGGLYKGCEWSYELKNESNS